MTILLVAEHADNVLKDSTHKALTAAIAMGGDIHVLVAGSQCGTVAQAASRRPPATEAAELATPRGVVEHFHGTQTWRS